MDSPDLQHSPDKGNDLQKAHSRSCGKKTKQLNPFRARKHPVMVYNPAVEEAARKDATQSKITVFDYKNGTCLEKVFGTVEEVYRFRDKDSVSWINIDGIRRKEVRAICDYFQVHQLTSEDIVSQGQRAKMDETGEVIFCLLPMLYFNAEDAMAEREQVSLLLMKNVVLSFQEDPSRDAFNTVRDKLRSDHSRLRAGGADALYNALLDAIVDQYFVVMEALGEKIEEVEDLIMKAPNNKTLVHVNHFRREVSLLRRTINPVRDLISGVLKTESSLIQKKTKTYFKDIYDHILQANETADNYRDLIVNLQDLYLNQVNLRMNEIMKVLAVVTALFAPLTLITGIYGMNFTHMPELHTRYGYFITLGVMFSLFGGMLYFFKKRGWF
jgi:magnesium transporter